MGWGRLSWERFLGHPDPATIVAVSTPRGSGGIGLVRLSGSGAVRIAAQLFRSRPPLGSRPRHVEFGHIVDSEGRAIDTALAWFLKRPASYTGEDTVEISTHGSEVLLEAVVAEATRLGAVPAGPGEFTKRAFLSGRIDLVQAEGVVELILAASHSGMRAAYGVVAGQLSDRIGRLRHQAVEALALVESVLDFPEEAQAQSEAVSALAGRLSAGAWELLHTFEGARRRRDGCSVVIVGRPNVGKSSLFNALLCEDRAIVTDVPGTTRDWLEGRVVWSGELIRLADTAGIRDSTDIVEQAGVAASKAVAAGADVNVVVIDGSAERAVALEELWGSGRAPTVIALSKSDLPRRVRLPKECDDGVVAVSARTGAGLEELKQAVLEELPRPDPDEGPGLLCERHRACVKRVADAGERAAASSRHSPELVAAELREALRALGELLGESVEDDVLDRIFSEFCIGK